jgi:hypothetical protein
MAPTRQDWVKFRRNESMASLRSAVLIMDSAFQKYSSRAKIVGEQEGARVQFSRFRLLYARLWVQNWVKTCRNSGIASAWNDPVAVQQGIRERRM